MGKDSNDSRGGVDRSLRENCVFFGCSDFSGLFRGRSYPVSVYKDKIATGCGWVPADQSLTPFGEIGPNNPFGPLGDLRLMPDPAAEYRCEIGPGFSPLHFLVSDIATPKGKPWECCARSWLKAGLDSLQEHGLTLNAAFEHEFTLIDDANEPEPVFSMRAQRQEDEFITRLVRALSSAGLEIDTVLPEYGTRQFEITLLPRPALRAADDAVAFREIVREVARACGRRASFSPKVRPEAVGNGVHIHFSLADKNGRPCNHDPNGIGELSRWLHNFCTGVLHHIRAVTAMSAPSVASYLRLGPHSWAAVFGCIGKRNREAALRICPASSPGDDPDGKHHVEFRVGDAASSPHLHLGALVHAGSLGLNSSLPSLKLVNTDPSEMPEEEREEFKALPGSLGEALEALTEDSEFSKYAHPLFWKCYLDMKLVEWEGLAGCDGEAITRKYKTIY